MNKLKPKNKICFQNNNNLHSTLTYQKLSKLKKKKWNIFKRNLTFKKELKPERRKNFFQKRLFEKQQFKNFYGCISESKLKRLFNNLIKKDNKINIFKNFIIKIESRLDVNILRLRLAKNIFHAKQLINHKKIKVNNIIVNKPGFLLKKGDLIVVIN